MSAPVASEGALQVIAPDAFAHGWLVAPICQEAAP